MRSRASIVRGHPLHPMLIPFPFAFLTGAFVFDTAAAIADNALWATAGAYMALAGIAMAVVAAIPGFIDFVYTVPPNSTAKKRATRHMLVNLTAVVLFVLGWLLRDDPAAEASIIQLIVEGIGTGLLMAGGWMGGVLVNRNQIGVDHRYAHAGKWREASVEPRGPGVALVVARSDELEVNQMKLVRVGDRRIALGRTEHGYVAFDDRCTHRGGSLADGVMICGTVQCPWHGSQFDARTGQVRAGPAEQGIGTYSVQEDGGEVRLIL